MNDFYSLIGTTKWSFNSDYSSKSENKIWPNQYSSNDSHLVNKNNFDLFHTAEKNMLYGTKTQSLYCGDTRKSDKIVNDRQSTRGTNINVLSHTLSARLNSFSEPVYIPIPISFSKPESFTCFSTRNNHGEFFPISQYRSSTIENLRKGMENLLHEYSAITHTVMHVVMEKGAHFADKIKHGAGKTVGLMTHAIFINHNLEERFHALVNQGIDPTIATNCASAGAIADTVSTNILITSMVKYTNTIVRTGFNAKNFLDTPADHFRKSLKEYKDIERKKTYVGLSTGFQFIAQLGAQMGEKIVYRAGVIAQSSSNCVAEKREEGLYLLVNSIVSSKDTFWSAL